ncbi:MAG: undecaprenyldiphospho-muramoylpentapeptide beta-N-acetylglucosaminyltransferase [Eubacteriales bacterium]|nr:undecaprenyldiphospho-muramoylpentapeptide beta-N-acetylglucosaminyltransferase [Eubacteriales bacterium]
MGDENKKKIILTGGGTAGHVTPNLALVPKLRERGYEILYIGSYKGIEKELCEKAGIDYVGISSGKLRRYVDLKNLTDPFRVLKGCDEAARIIRKFKPDIVFSKGGFVAVPVVLAAKAHRVPIISHESDMTPGLANKIAAPSSTKICCNFPETLRYLPEGKGVLTGSPIREELLRGSREEGLKKTGFDGSKPILLVIGGSLGAVHINDAVRAALPVLTEKYDIIHICGKGNLDDSLDKTKGYVQYAYVTDSLKDLFAAADLFVSRAGANAICEILALRKPNLLIPLSAEASRGDQILNAKSFKRQGFSRVLNEEDMTVDTLIAAIDKLYEKRYEYIARMSDSRQSDGVNIIINLIEENRKK